MENIAVRGGIVSLAVIAAGSAVVAAMMGALELTGVTPNHVTLLQAVIIFVGTTLALIAQFWVLNKVDDIL